MRVRTSWSRKNKPNNFYPIYVSKDLTKITLTKKPDYYEVLPKTLDGREWAWKNIPKSFIELNKNGYFVAVKNNKHLEIFHKYREKQVFKNVWTNKKYHSEFHGTNILKDMIGQNKFEYPKSLYLIEDILKITSRKNSIILDFFAGSGTTGHAVLNLNKYDGGERQFILCTNNENKIASEVCLPRITGAILGYTKANGQITQGLGGNLKYYQTDFVPTSPFTPTDSSKEILTRKAIEMLILKEGTFDNIIETPNYTIYRSSSKYTGIILDQTSFSDFKKSLSSIEEMPINLYIFSLTDDDFSKDFADMKDILKICPIPEAILRVYRRIFR